MNTPAPNYYVEVGIVILLLLRSIVRLITFQITDKIHTFRQQKAIIRDIERPIQECERVPLSCRFDKAYSLRPPKKLSVRN